MLTFESEAQAVLALALGSELAALLMTSDASVSAAKEGVDTSLPALTWASAQATGVMAVVVPATGVKCPRCWNFRTTVGSDDSYPEVCSPCATVLNQQH